MPRCSPQKRKFQDYRLKRKRTAIDRAWQDVQERAAAERLAAAKERRKWTG